MSYSRQPTAPAHPLWSRSVTHDTWSMFVYRQLLELHNFVDTILGWEASMPTPLTLHTHTTFAHWPSCTHGVAQQRRSPGALLLYEQSPLEAQIYPPQEKHPK